jgi:hypothetical protein
MPTHPHRVDAQAPSARSTAACAPAPLVNATTRSKSYPLAPPRPNARHHQTKQTLSWTLLDSARHRMSRSQTRTLLLSARHRLSPTQHLSARLCSPLLVQPALHVLTRQQLEPRGPHRVSTLPYPASRPRPALLIGRPASTHPHLPSHSAINRSHVLICGTYHSNPAIPNQPCSSTHTAPATARAQETTPSLQTTHPPSQPARQPAAAPPAGTYRHHRLQQQLPQHPSQTLQRTSSRGAGTERAAADQQLPFTQHAAQRGLAQSHALPHPTRSDTPHHTVCSHPPSPASTQPLLRPARTHRGPQMQRYWAGLVIQNRPAAARCPAHAAEQTAALQHWRWLPAAFWQPLRGVHRSITAPSGPAACAHAAAHQPPHRPRVCGMVRRSRGRAWGGAGPPTVLPGGARWRAVAARPPCQSHHMHVAHAPRHSCPSVQRCVLLLLYAPLDKRREGCDATEDQSALP